jgi:multidrug efflux pump subunit AcrA (membrane-fusion protein)
MRIRRSVLACVLVAACRVNAAAPHDAEVDVAAKASVDARRDAPDKGPVVRIPAPFACELHAVQVTRGQHVTRGTRLALLVSLDAAVSPLHHAEAERIAADHTYARMKELYALGELSIKDVEDAQERAAYASAEVARLRALAAFVADAAAADLSDEVASQYYEILRAPVDGVVLAVPTGACVGDLFAIRPDE